MRQLKIIPIITRRDEGQSIDKYLQEIAKLKLATIEEEVELAHRIRKGDKAALDRLTTSNLRFVVSVAKQYQNQGLSLPELISVGNEGLIRAAHKFDETRGFKFISYAVWWIRQSILQAIAQQSPIVRLPLNQVNLQKKINKSIIKFEQQYERRPSVEEIAMDLDISETKIIEALSAKEHHVSFDAPLSDGDDSNIYDLFPNTDTPSTDNILLKESLSVEINRILSTITERERDVILLSFGIGCKEESLEEIGYRYGLSGERVRQLREKAIKRLKHHSKKSVLKQYL